MQHVWEIVIAGVILFLLYTGGKLALAVIGAFLDEDGWVLWNGREVGHGDFYAAVILKQLAIGAMAIIVLGTLAVSAYRNRPGFLTRSTAATAIESTARFQHGTKLYFTIGQIEIEPGVCHNFRFSTGKANVWNEYRDSGALKFSAWGDQSESKPEQGPVSFGSMDLADGIYLTDDIERCAPHAAEADIGQYELAIGRPVVEVNGIQENGSHATVDFIWYFQSLNEIGQSLAQIKGRKESIQYEKNLSGEEKAKAPFWNGSAEMLKFDDGWRVTTIKGLDPDDSMMGTNWRYGPETWPDVDFNWGTFDEDENRW